MLTERFVPRTPMPVILIAACLAMTSAAAGRLEAVGPEQQTSGATAPSPSPAVLDQYCVTCHSDRLRTGGLTLEAVDLAHVGANADVLEKVVRKLRGGQMPPPRRPRPDKATTDAFVASLETALDRVAEASPSPGRPAIHRLNRVEYTNAIRDLLALDIDSRSLLPTDDSGYGFDNNADMLSVTAATLDRYMSAAVKIGRLAIGDPRARPVNQTYSVSRFLKQSGRMSEDLSFGTYGGLAVDHYFPLDGEYQLTIRLIRDTIQGYIIGVDQPTQIEATLEGALLEHWTVGGEVTEGGDYIRGIAIDEDNPAHLRRHSYRQNADEKLQLRFAAKAGRRVVGVAFAETAPGISEGVSRPSGFRGFRTVPGVDTVAIAGPYNATVPEDTPSRRKIFVCTPAGSPGSDDEAQCAEKILSTLARRAYRRPVTEADIQTLMRFYEDGRRKGGFERGIQAAMERVLVAPEFLFRIERGPADASPGTVFRLSDVELASRLSFFLWSSIPDEELLEVAELGRLKEPRVLAQQVRRMLADARATALVNNFAGQWLLVRNVRLAAPDPNLFPAFDDNLKDALTREMELFFESQFREDRSVLDLLRADYTYVNDRLADHYGIPNIQGSHFRRVVLTDPSRFGLLGKGSVLLVTSYAHRTSPVVRGKWILENLLGVPPPPPPPDVPDLKENDESTPTSLRERMEQHRASPVCASCHSQMDPLGFTLENFDAVGRWRDLDDGGNPVDASGVLLDGTTVDGPVEFRNALLDHREEFVATLTEKLLTYALGRGTRYSDMPAVRRIVRDAAQSEYRWSDLILGVANSTPFQMSKTPVDDVNPATATVAERR